MTAPTPLLEVRNLEVVYSDVILVLRGISLTVPAGAVVALLGANGAGKTTLLRAVSGLLDVHRGDITKGSVTFDGAEIHTRTAPEIVRRGLAQVMEGRRIFEELSVEDNLTAGAFTVGDAATRKARREEMLARFPVLAQRRKALAGYLSGGEQQMCALGRALMTAPRLLLLDEPSLGLAPLVVRQIGDIVRQVHAAGTSVLLVEQNAELALSLASYAYVLENGKIVKEGTSADLREDQDIREFYLGAGEAGRRSYRDVKTYRRKKRWSA
ncbi:MAG: ABC transporter ATP-binding protein [Gemmatimonadetes bacterium]|nr:ABC transporter ATP-binding protein [Gemmatimonadota bacterium]